MTDNSQGPAALDLDKIEREGGSPKPFDFVLDGKRYVMSDPQEIDWQDLLSAMSNPVMFFRLVLPPDEQNEFFRTRLSAWRMNKLMTAYQDHYGLPSQGNPGALPR